MDERKLRAYFTVPTWRAELVLAAGVVGLLLFLLAAPGTAGYEALHHRVAAVFVDELQAKAAPFEVIFLLGYILFLFLAPITLVGLGVAALRQRAQIRNFSDAQADALLSQRMRRLPELLEERLGLAPMAEDDALLVLWGPTPKDRSLMHPLDLQKRRELKTTPGRFAVGKDGLVRFVKLHVLVLEKRGAVLFVLNGFYNLVHQQLAGETWGEYRLAQAKKVKENPEDCRVALLMDDGTQFVVNLLTRQEGARLSQEAAYPLVIFPEAGEKLRHFCEIQQAMVATPVSTPILPSPPTPVPETEGVPTVQTQPAAPAEDQARLRALEARLRTMCHGDAALMERLITQAGGRTRTEAVDEAIRRLERDNQSA